MRIVICSSLSFPKEILNSKKKLELSGHSVFIPPSTKKYLEGKFKKSKKDDLKAKIAGDGIRLYYKEIKKSDAILVLNISKNGVENYIGPSAFLEIGFAHVLKKKIYLLNKIPKQNISGELVFIKPVIIDGALDKVK